LVTELCGRGWTFLTDDILPLDPVGLRVLPFPQTPAFRPDPGRELPDDWLTHVAKTEVSVDDRVGRDPLPVGAVVLPVARRSGAPQLEPWSAAEAVLEMAHGCWNFARHGERAIAVMARLTAGVPVLRLTFARGGHAAEVLARWAAETWPDAV
jgi:hypothetical protein